MKINNFRGDLTDISGRIEPLLTDISANNKTLLRTAKVQSASSLALHLQLEAASLSDRDHSRELCDERGLDSGLCADQLRELAALSVPGKAQDDSNA